MAKQSTDELEYKDFLKQISFLSSKVSLSTDDISFGKPKKSASEVYQELCYDYPLVTKEELEILKDYLQKVQFKTSSTIKVARRVFYDGIVYGVRKYQSSDRGKDVSKFALISPDTQKIEKKSEDTDSQQQISKLYIYLCAFVFIKYVKHYTHLAAMKDLDALNQELSFFKLKKKNQPQTYQENDPSTSETTPTDEPILAKDQDEDDTPYEPIDPNSQSFFAWEEKGKKNKRKLAKNRTDQDIEGTNADSSCSWSEISEKLSDIVSMVSYDLIASDQVWEDLNIAQDIIEIVDNIRKAYRANSQVDLR
jgi:hypothetical protein